MKRILILVAGLLLIGANAFAQGDLIVNGHLGLGTSTPSAKLDILTDTDAVNVLLTQTSDAAVRAANYQVDIDGSTQVFVTTGFNSFVRHIGTSSPLPAARASLMQFHFRSPTAGTSTFSFVRGLDLEIRDFFDNVRNYSGDEITMFRTGGSYTGTGNITVTDLIGASIEDLDANPGILSATNVYGLKIAQQTTGTNNYGIALLGDGAGADIVFGPSKDASIYSSAGELFVKDSGSNVTQISPHDPETGEWRFYSKNVKTGKVIEVNMEKLVKAVEKLTGEKFMIESYEAAE